MRIALVITGLDVGGAENLLYELSLGLSNRGHQIIVINLLGDAHFSNKLRDTGIPNISLGINPSLSANPFKIYSFFSGLLQLGRQISDFRPDLLHTWMYPADLLGGVVGSLLRIPVVWGIFSGKTDRQFYKIHTYLIMKACAKLSKILPTIIISCSAYGRKSHAAFGYPTKNINFIPIGISIPTPNPLSKYSKSRFTSTGKRILCLGMLARYAPEKNHALLLRSVARIKNEGAKLHLFLAGGTGIDISNEELMQTIDYFQLVNEVTLLGRADEISDFFSLIDIFCLLSESEGFPTVVAEAMAASLPCLASDVGDTKLILSDNKQIARSRVKDDEYSKLVTLCRMSDDDRRQIGMRNCARISHLFTKATMLSRYENAYERTLSLNSQSS